MRKQCGVTLIELMVAMVVSLIVSGAMVAVMANTLGTGTRTINMTHLTQELRTALQIMTRDLRRANYLEPTQAATCFANIDCLVDLGIADKIGAVEVSTGDDCMSFWLDRTPDGTITGIVRTGFRLAVTGGIGRIEMLTDDTSTAMDGNNCPTGTWVAITDPDTIDVQSFVVNNDDTYVLGITTGGSTQTVQKLQLTLSADLITAGSIGYTISRTIGDDIRVRNDFTTL